MYICPRCGHNRFIAPDVYTYPNKADKWECAECGYADSPDSFESDECD